MTKKRKIIFLILLIGISASAAIHIRSRQEIHLTKEGQIIRNTWGQGSYPMKLQAQTDYGMKEITIEVAQQVQQKEKTEVQQEEKKSLSENERFFQLLEQEVRRQVNDQTEEEIILPTVFQGVKVGWQEIREPREIWMLIFTAAAVFMAAYFGEKEEKKKREKKEQNLRREYAEFVEKLRLYLMAGLSTRNAFLTITKQYASLKKMSKGKRDLLKELTIACNMLQNGVREEEVYLQWGGRCGDKSYRKLSFLLSVNLKRGKQDIIENLQREVLKNQERQRDEIKKIGEEASTKLLFPMALFLMVVMILVICPAYNKIGGL